MFEKLKNKIRNSKLAKVFTASAAMSAMAVVPAFASETEASSSTILTGVTSVLEWYLTSMTSITNWLVGNPLGAIYLAIFVIGGAVALMFRVLHSC